MLKLEFSSRMKRDAKRLQRQGKDMGKLETVLGLLAEERSLPQQYRDHALSGPLKEQRECHIEPDWLLVYKIDRGMLILTAMATGSHAQLFRL